MRTDIDQQKEQIVVWLEAGVSRAEICRRLRCKYITLRSRLEKWGVSHLKNQPGKGNPKYGCRKHVSEYLHDGSLIKSYKLKKKLWRDKYKEKKCEECGLTHWLGHPAPLELDHIDGDNWNNTLENLRIVCPNCHALTPTNAGKNIGKYNATVL